MAQLLASNKRQVLIIELQRKIKAVEDAISQVSCIRNSLEDNAEKVKAEIHLSFARHLEQLQSRQEQLLRQVDVLKSNQMSLLQTQHARLYHCLGNLQSSLQCVEDQSNDFNFTAVITKDMESVSRMKSQKQPFFAACLNDDVLKKSIQEFGGLDMSNTLLSFPPLEDSMCLPGRVEEYGDGDHHVLYKTLEELRAESGTFKVKPFPAKFSNEPNEWLSNIKEEMQMDTQENAEFEFLNDNDADLQRWLYSAGQNDSSKLDDFQMVDFPPEQRTSLASTSSIEVMSSCGSSADKTKSLSELSGNSEWLSKRYKNLCRQINNGVCTNGNSSCCANGEVEIENLASAACLTASNLKTSADMWLMNKAAEHESSSMMMPTLENVCRANELCNSFYECMCDLNCATDSLCVNYNNATDEYRRKSAILIAPMLNLLYGKTSEWISSGQNVPEKWAHRAQNMQNDVKNWLSSTSTVEYERLPSSELVIENGSDGNWLSGIKQDHSQNNESVATKIADMFRPYFEPYDVDDWLLSQHGGTCTSNDLANKMRSMQIAKNKPVENVIPNNLHSWLLN